jgi:hypothetical protein
MMKRFARSGKIVGLALMVMGLVLAGCQGPQDGSSEGAAPNNSQGYTSVPITVEPDGDGANLYIGDGGLSEVAVFNGHTVEIKNGNTSIVGGQGRCSGSGGDVQCWIRLINRDSDEFMANTILHGGNCQNCTTAVMDNGDWGEPGNRLDPPQSYPIATGTGFTYDEDTYDAPWGASKYPVPQGFSKPFQVLHPQCGQRVEIFDFGNQIPRFTFYATVDADYFPWNPLGANGQPGGGDDDPRFEFQNHTTVYLMLCDFVNQYTLRTDYARGSWRRSNILAGWGSPGNVSSINVAAGDYFSVNVGIEFADRMETNSMGDLHNFPAEGYHYFNMHSVLFTYNPRVIERNRTNRAAKGHSATARTPCFTEAICNTPGTEAYQHLDALVDGSNVVYGNGYIFSYRFPVENFGYYAGNINYKTDSGGIIALNYSTQSYVTVFHLKEGGHKGVAHWNKAYVGGTLLPANPNVKTQEGADAAPDMVPLMAHFYVKGTVGSGYNAGNGSYIKVDVFSTYTAFQFFHTNNTLIPGGAVSPTDDYWNPCIFPRYNPAVKYDTTPGHVQFCAPGRGTQDYDIFQQTENVNLNIYQSGQAAPGQVSKRGGFQAWNLYVCVQ